MRIFHSICLSVLVSALGAVVAISFGRFLGSEGSTIMTTPEFIITLFLLVLILIVVYRERKKEFYSFIRNFDARFLFLCALSLLH